MYSLLRLHLLFPPRVCTASASLHIGTTVPNNIEVGRALGSAHLRLTLLVEEQYSRLLPQHTALLVRTPASVLE